MGRKWMGKSRWLVYSAASLFLLCTPQKGFPEGLDLETRIEQHALNSAQRDVASLTAAAMPIVSHVPAHNATAASTAPASPAALSAPAPVAVGNPSVTAAPAAAVAQQAKLKVAVPADTYHKQVGHTPAPIVIATPAHKL